MSVPSPASAPPRPDLTWLRARRRSAPTSPANPAVDYHPTTSGGAAAPTSAVSVDYHHHGSAGSSLDLSAPPPAADAPVSSTLDLSTPARAHTPASGSAAAPPVSSSLDLGAVDTAPPEPLAAVPATRVVPARRVSSGPPLVLNTTDPVVTLTRLQSGIGTVTVEAACSNAVGDLHLAAAFRLSNGLSSLATNRDGLALGPRGSRTPALRVHHDRYDTLTLDCRRVRELDRLLLLGYSPSGAELAWGGTLILTTLAGARVEVPMDGPKAQGAVALVTIYQVDGELVVRAEPREVSTTVREACLAFGFDRITWLDPSTPAS